MDADKLIEGILDGTIKLDVAGVTEDGVWTLVNGGTREGADEERLPPERRPLERREEVAHRLEQQERQHAPHVAVQEKRGVCTSKRSSFSCQNRRRSSVSTSSSYLISVTDAETVAVPSFSQ